MKNGVQLKFGLKNIKRNNMKLKQTTAIEWLIEKLSEFDSSIIDLFNNEVQTAKELEKKQINNAFLKGYDYCNNRDLENQDDDFEFDYYDETF